VQRLGAEGVFFVGWRGHDVLAEMLGCSDVFAAPSVDEPFGLVYLEAMAAGVPPIATATGGPLSFINVDRDQPTGWLIAPDDVQALADAIVDAVADPVRRRARGAAAARFVREEYSWTTTAARFADLYRDVIAERTSPLRRAGSGGQRRGVRT
jgi:glycosyltransferase involved in cell wall biosynthesis